MKKIVFLLALTTGFGQVSYSQDRYFTRDGEVSFHSATPMEDIDAENHKMTCVVDMETGSFEFAVLIKSFEFEKALMEEHFNENYMESGTYPKATFVGTIQGLKDVRDSGFPPGVELVAKGKMTIHGVTKDVTIVGYITNTNGTYTLTSKFKVKPEDYNIAIPNAVRDNIAKEIEVSVNAVLKPLTK
jgi:polyisoprenoid-binding protein YceI